MYQYRHKAFTMLELVFVIVILGIVASVGSSIIAQTFESYLMQRSVHNASLKTELAINQIANRLLYTIHGSELALNPATNGMLNLIDVLPLNNTHTALLWIGYEHDGFNGTTNPAWSGVANLPTSTFATISTPASRLQNNAGNSPSEQTILTNLNNAGVNDNNPQAAIKFVLPNNQPFRRAPERFYDALCMHQTVSAQSCMFPVNIANNNNTLNFTGWGNRANGQMTYSEFYQLAASAYAVVPRNNRVINGLQIFDLDLFYDYQPWQGETYQNGNQQLLINNVSVFRFKQEGNTIRLKLCTVEQTGLNDTISICKEKAVIR